MKCRNCGAELDLLDKICPHCGSENLQSAGHIAEMERYEERSRKEKKRLKRSLAENMPLVISTVIMALLIVAVSAATYVAENAVLFEYRSQRAESLKKSDEYSEILREYLEDGDYTGFTAFKELHVIPEYEDGYREFEKVCELAKDYSRMMNAVEEAVLLGENGTRYSPENYISDCRSGIDRFYSDYESVLGSAGDDRYRAYMLDMKKKADIAMKIYLGLEGAGLEDFLALSMNKQEVYLEEVIAGE